MPREKDKIKMVENTPGADSMVPSPAIADQILGELIHAGDLARMACAALVARGLVNREVFERMAAQIEQNWLAAEANGDDFAPDAIAWSRRRMTEFIEDLAFAHVASPARRTAVDELMRAAHPVQTQIDTEPAHDEAPVNAK